MLPDIADHGWALWKSLVIPQIWAKPDQVYKGRKYVLKTQIDWPVDQLHLPLLIPRQ